MVLETLETSRLFLQKLSPEVMKKIFEENEGDEIKKILGVMTEQAFEKHKKIYEKGYESYNRSMFNFQLVEKSSNRIIGNCGYHTWNPQHQRAEIGYELNSDEHKNKGYMTEALEKIIKYGFQTMKLNRIEAVIDSNNIPSLKLLQKFGFSKEGTMRRHYLVGKIFEDSDLYSLLKSEFETKKPDS